MRTDRRFCSQQCRLWWYRHPGQKRPDFAPKYWGQPEPLRKVQQLEDQKLRAKLSVLNDESAASKKKLQTEMNELHDELNQTRQQITRAEQQARDAVAKAAGLQENNEGLAAQLQHAKADTAQREAALEQVSSDLAELRGSHAQRCEQHGEELRALKSQTAELVQRRDELRSRFEAAERSLAQRDEDLSLKRRHLEASERAHQAVHAVAESESRSLRAEKQRRIAAEQRVEQLTRDLETLAKESQAAPTSDTTELLIGKRKDVLTAELQEVRTHRDEVIAEREQLAARILQLMTPGQYLEHAAAAGYDLTKDPLIRLKREEVVVENHLADWQQDNNKRRRARRRDPEQTIDEQAYAAALAFRWKQIDHPHLRRKHHPKWIAIGFLLDKESEAYLLTLTRERIDAMKKRMASADDLL